MTINKGLWILIRVNGVDGAISQSEDGKAYLTLFGPERILGDMRSGCSPFGQPPSQNDNSAFAKVYRQLGELVKQKKITGPFGEDRSPSLCKRFIWNFESSQHEMLQLLTKSGMKVEIQEIPHKGDDNEVLDAINTFSQWMTRSTVVKPNPLIIVRKKDISNSDNHENLKKNFFNYSPRFYKSLFCFVLLMVLIVSMLFKYADYKRIAIIAILFPVSLYFASVIVIVVYVRRFDKQNISSKE